MSIFDDLPVTDVTADGELRTVPVESILTSLPTDVQRRLRRAEAEREAALAALLPEVRARVEQELAQMDDELLYGNRFTGADGRRIDPRDIRAQ